MNFLLGVALYVGLFGLLLASAGQQNNSSVVIAIAFVVILLGVLHMFGSKRV